MGDAAVVRRWGEALSRLGVTQSAGRRFLDLLEEQAGGRREVEESRVEPAFVLRQDADDPFQYQEDLSRGVVERAGAVGSAALLALPTGAGKTRTTMNAVGRLFEEGMERVVWLAPSRELLDQAVAAAEAAWRRERVSVDVQASLAHRGGRLLATDTRAFIFGSIQMILSRLAQVGPYLQSADLIVVDEAHYAGAPRFYRAIRSGRSESNFLLGLSATPGRAQDGSQDELLALFDATLLVAEKLGGNPIATLQEMGVLSRLEFREIELESTIQGLRRGVQGQGFATHQIIQDPRRFPATIMGILTALEGGRALVFCHDLAHACAVTAALEAKGVGCAVISGSGDQAWRERALRRFAAGQIDALVNVRVLTTGYDLPALPSVVLTAPVESPVLFEQIVGRVARGPLTGGTEIGTIWQVDDHLAMHGLPRSYYRFDDAGWKRLAC